MRPLSEAAARIAGQSFSRKYIALGRIVNSWREIVGDDLATKAQPARLQYRKREKAKTAEAVLEIATSGADATLLHYQKDLILERINHIFGERWITAIKFVAASSNSSAVKLRKTKSPLTEGEKNTLSDMLKTLPEGGLKTRLYALGQEILMERKS